MRRFSLGDRVSWRKLLKGGWSTRVGTVVQVLAAGELPDDWNLSHPPYPRDVESYVVRQNDNGPLLWPPVDALSISHLRTTRYATKPYEGG